MARAKSLFHSTKHAINFLARSAAKKIVTEQMRDQGRRMTLVPIREIHEQAERHLAQHPELYQQALERAKQMGYVELQPSMVTPDDQRSERNS
jgi:hypothetical protein